MAKQKEERAFRVPMSAPDLTEAERKAVAAVLDTPRLSMGPQVEAFEAAVASFVGVKHAVAVSSGTAGLHLCVRAAGIGEGDLVLTTPYSFVASSNVLLYERAVPVFVDVDPVTGNLDPAMAAQAIEDLAAAGTAGQAWLPRQGAGHVKPPKAMLTVDVFGQPADYDALETIATEHDLALIEDACEAIGSVRGGKHAGTFGDAGVFAFYPNKQMTTAEGGMMVSDRDEWAQMARSLRNQGRAPGDTWLEHTHLGYNYRLNELNAALGVAQMKRIEELLEGRQRVAGWYVERLAALDRVRVQPIDPATDRMSWFVFVVRLDPALERVKIAHELAAAGIPSRPYFRPIHLQPYFVERFGYRAGDFSVAEELGDRSLALPFSGVMTEEQVDLVAEALKRSVE
jgi:dTDP-4-amino-4,6-dideoxygalactose transaminase